MSSAPDSPPPTATRILVVDDDTFTARLISAHLTGAGYVVTSVADGVDALEAVRANPVDLLVTDWQMPRMDGLALCRAVRAMTGVPWVYTIVLTACDGSDAVVEAFDAGADDYLAKPFDARELLARVRAGERIVRLERDLQRRTTETQQAHTELQLAFRELAKVNRQLDRLALTDDLTGLANRRAAMTNLDRTWDESARHDDPLAIIVLDIDHFKHINDTLGHAVGDLTLQRVATALRDTARAYDGAARIGGEEFLVLCPRSSEVQAAVLAERLRDVVAALTIETDQSCFHVTVSVGVAERVPGMRSPDDLLRAADTALYEAKGRGRNRIERASALAAEPVLPDAG